MLFHMDSQAGGMGVGGVLATNDAKVPLAPYMQIPDTMQPTSEDR